METIRSEDGATAAEYALLLGVIVLVIFVGALAFGQAVGGLYDRIVNEAPL